MKKSKKWGLLSSVLIVSQCISPFSGLYVGAKTDGDANTTTYAVESDTPSIYEQRFLELYDDIYDKENGYFNDQGIPYHSVETLMVEAPDHGHESTSETASYLLWLQAMKGRITKDYSGVESAWDTIEKYYIPTSEDQPGQYSYNPSKPATYAAEYSLPDYYPSQLKFDVKVGQDPLYTELRNTYGTPQMYGMHWLIDVDNFYGYGKRGDGVSTPSYINTYQRGEQESVWETIPHPSWETFKWGGDKGFLPFFTGDNSYSKQWRYTIASDADARVVQAMYHASEWAKEDNKSLDKYVAKASKMGDYLRYSMFDKYFMKVGAQGLTAASGRDSAHYLLSWYYSWGGSMDDSWSWRIGSSHNHFGYQNPMAAWVLSNDTEFIPKSQTAQSDWSKSLDRQLEFYQWLQSSEGAIAGGATNSYNGSYDKYPAGISTFYDMAYEEAPVYADPGSNEWFGMQCWSMQRMAELYYQTGDTRAKAILDKWANWGVSEVQLKDDGTYLIPSTLKWSGQPDTWTGKSTGNPNLHVTVANYGHDIGVTSSLANTLTYYAAGLQKHTSDTSYQGYVSVAKELLNRMWSLYRDDKGIGDEQELTTMLGRFFDQKIAVPDNYSGTMANGDKIEKGSTFFSIRTGYEKDPDFKRLKDAYDNKKPFSMVYHRFWAQSEAAIALGVMDEFFPEDGASVVTPVVSVTSPSNSATFDWANCENGITVKADATIAKGSINKVEFYADGVKFAEDSSADYQGVYVPTKTGAVNGKKTIVLKAIAYADNNTVKTSNEVTITITMPKEENPTNPDINVEFKSQGGDSSNIIGGQFKVTAKKEVNLSDVKLRYYYTLEDEIAQNAYIDSVSLSMTKAPWYVSLNSSTQVKIVQVSGNNYYMEISFNTDLTLDESGKLELGIRLSKANWSNFDQTNDYSYKSGVIVLYKDEVISGVQPY
ncbi:glycoside hydrolase family 48 protein [Anaerosporobacter sp.]